ncbi:MAG: carboxyl transferase domain-containing protein [Alphaproteobacteria bacterium]|nr:carboxyl transferase domain-containing protein [Alphaproteobacteria bacterium]
MPHPSFKRLLIANRGEIAIRIARAAAEMGIGTVAVHTKDDDRSLHVKAADLAVVLPGVGARGYLDIGALIAVAKAQGCDALHPGYGFLSENAALARACAEAGVVFIGPGPDALDLLGDKVAARALAAACDVPLLEGTGRATTLKDARAFVKRLGAAMIKASAGGGGRGMRPVSRVEDVDAAYALCEAEAKAAFGDGALYLEHLVPRARHIEVQIVADTFGGVSHLWERDCTLQRRNQKIIEIAPAPWLSNTTRIRIVDAAVRMAKSAAFTNVGTFEFLVDAENGDDFWFMEANPRLQVEHTITEEVTGVDIVQTQLALAGGAALADLGLATPAAPVGYAIQVRVNLETMNADGAVASAAGVLTIFELPSGPGVRVDSAGYAGFEANPNYDSLIAKVIVHARTGGIAAALCRAVRALDETRIEGANTNLVVLRALLAHPAIASGAITTRFVEHEIGGLLAAPSPLARTFVEKRGAQVAARRASVVGPHGTEPAPAPLRATVVSLDVREGDTVRRGQQIAVLEAMKMQHVVTAPISGIVRVKVAALGDTLGEGEPLYFIAPQVGDDHAYEEVATVDPDHIRADLRAVIDRHAFTVDTHRPEAVARRRKTNQRTARENIDALVDPGTFIEYGALVIAAQRRRRPVDDLIANTPADGMITGLGAINGVLFDETKSRAAVLAYDYTVLAGTQGHFNHKKTDRILAVAKSEALPVVWFCEGGGGRPGDVDAPGATGLDTHSFYSYAALSGLAPRIGIASGRCFAGNAVFFGCSDITIATKNVSVGLGGPAMIEGGGLGVYHPDEVGPIAMQTANGVVDIVVDDEEAAAVAAKRALGYFQGAVTEWRCPDQRLLRQAIPENRLRVYDIRGLIGGLADEGSVLELRRDFGIGIVTAYVRIEGRPVGLIANNPMHLGGAIDSDASDKAARFLQLCDGFDIPVLSLIDTPGFMVGPESEKTAAVRKGSRFFVTAANMSVPVFAVVVRKGYGLGAQAMAGGSLQTPFFCVSWPTGEFGGMGLEGAVRLGYRKELEAEGDPVAQKALYEKLVARQYAVGKATSVAAFLEIDAVIDPAETRAWIVRGLKSACAPQPRAGKKRPFIDTW